MSDLVPDMVLGMVSDVVSDVVQDMVPDFVPDIVPGVVLDMVQDTVWTSGYIDSSNFDSLIQTIYLVRKQQVRKAMNRWCSLHKAECQLNVWSPQDRPFYTRYSCLSLLRDYFKTVDNRSRHVLYGISLPQLFPSPLGIPPPGSSPHCPHSNSLLQHNSYLQFWRDRPKLQEHLWQDSISCDNQKFGYIRSGASILAKQRVRGLNQCQVQSSSTRFEFDSLDCLEKQTKDVLKFLAPRIFALIFFMFMRFPPSFALIWGGAMSRKVEFSGSTTS